MSADGGFDAVHVHGDHVVDAPMKSIIILVHKPKQRRLEHYYLPRCQSGIFSSFAALAIFFLET